MSSELLTWWLSLCAAAVLNACFCGWAAWQVHRQRARLPADIHAARVQLLWLAAIYTLGCGFRSFLPMIDVPRLCLHSTWISRIAVGRTVATVAELSLAAQLALSVRAASSAPGGAIAARVSPFIVPVIALAELCSWTAVLRKNFFMHAVENSLWTLMAVLVIAALIPLCSRAVGQRRRLFAVAMVCAAAYVLYMSAVDVPMYVSRWHADVAVARQHPSLSEGFRELLQRCTVARDGSAWRQDLPWLSLYFTAAVWISLGLAYATPVILRAQDERTSSARQRRPQPA
jgi:hypothetical protein